MKKHQPSFASGLLVLTGFCSIEATLLAQSDAKAKVEPKFSYEQKPIAGTPQLISSGAVAATLESFKAAYPKLGSPRILIYINRELVDQNSGMKLAGREETVVSTKREASRGVQSETTEIAGRGQPADGATTAETTTSGEAAPGKAVVSSTEKKVANVNRYETTEREQESLEYRQSVRDVEQVFGRRLRSAGATLADQRVATQLIGDRPLSAFTAPTEGEQAHKDRAALAKIADVVLEILISEREMSVPKISGNVTRKVPEIYATAIRLSDSRIMGQANALDIIGHKSQAVFVSNNISAREIADATAIFLMEDMLLGVE